MLKAATSLDTATEALRALIIVVSALAMIGGVALAFRDGTRFTGAAVAVSGLSTLAWGMFLTCWASAYVAHLRFAAAQD
jgi:hypothetical protein